MEKTGGKKSRATVPLIKQQNTFTKTRQILEKKWEEVT
jgi:hypothetical protein